MPTALLGNSKRSKAAPARKPMVNPLLADPTRTGLLRRRFEKEMARRFNRVRQRINQLIIEEDAFGISRIAQKQLAQNPLMANELLENETHKFSSTQLNLPRHLAAEILALGNQINSDDLAAKGRETEPHITVRYGLHADNVGGVEFKFVANQIVTNTRWMFLTEDQQLEQFKLWLQTQLLVEVLTKGSDYKDYWLTKYIEDAYKKGAGRAFDDVRKPALVQKLDFYAGTKQEFLNSAFNRPVAANRVRLLASRTLSDLQGVTDAMAQAMSRELVDGMIQGQSPRVVASNITKHVGGIGKKRALMIARTETIRAHNEGQLDSLETLGVTDIGVMVEWDTAKDFRVCPLCRPLQGIILKTKEAHGMLPRHPNCRCAYLPANTGESTKGQIRGKSRIESAIDKSIRAEMPKRKKRTLAQQKKLTKWAGADKTVAKQRPKAIL